jgi:hypothetical protein
VRAGYAIRSYCWWWTIEIRVPVGSVWSITPAVIAVITIITLVSAPVVIASAAASSSAPGICTGAYANFEVEIAGHVTEHVTPHIIEKIEVVIPAVIPAPAIPTVIVVPGHVKRVCAGCQQD